MLNRAASRDRALRPGELYPEFAVNENADLSACGVRLVDFMPLLSVELRLTGCETSRGVMVDFLSRPSLH